MSLHSNTILMQKKNMSFEKKNEKKNLKIFVDDDDDDFVPEESMLKANSVKLKQSFRFVDECNFDANQANNF